MNKIDVSMIRGNPSNMFNTQQEQICTVTKRSSLDEHLEKTITPLPKRTYSESELTDSLHKRKHRLFQKLSQQNGKEQSSSSSKSKFQFKIPSINDYYIKQSKEYLLPVKLHRFQSLIEEPIKQEKKLISSVRYQQSVKNEPMPIIAKQRYSLLTTCIIILLLVSSCCLILLT